MRTYYKVETPTLEIEALARYAAWALHAPEGRADDQRRCDQTASHVATGMR